MARKLLLTGLIFLLASLFIFNSKLSVYAQEEEDSFSPDEIIVKFRSQIKEGEINDLNQFLGTRMGERLSLPQVFSLKVPRGKVKQFTDLFSRSHLVEFAEPNYVARAFVIPNDPSFDKQWGMTKIGAPQAWEITTGDGVVKIAILDSGIDQDHEDLAGKIDKQKNFTASRTLDDKYGHGTHVAGIAAANTNNGKGVAGLGYKAKLLNAKVLNDNGSGYYSWIANGIKWAADNGAKVINLSLGGPSASRTLEEAVNYAWAKGAVLACAAGNSGKESPNYPAYYQNCLATAATDDKDQKASFSAYGSSWVDVAAPGVNIFSTIPNQKSKVSSKRNYDYLSGTSMATPHVAGLAALVWATGKCQNLDAPCVRAKIEDTAYKATGTETYWAKGRIDAYAAVSSK